MKTLSALFLLFTLFSKVVIAQSRNNIYIYDSTVSGGHIKLIEYPNTRVDLKEFSETIDSSADHHGDYLTTFAFRETGDILNRTITVSFDKPVCSCELKYSNGVSNVAATHNREKTQYHFVISYIKSDEFSFVIYGKEKFFTKIYE